MEVLGVPVGEVESIDPRQGQHQDHHSPYAKEWPSPPTRQAIVVAPNLVSARTIELAPMYSGGPKLQDNASIGEERTAVPVEWDDVKDRTDRAECPPGSPAGLTAGPPEPGGRPSGRPPSTAKASRSAKRYANCLKPRVAWAIPAPTWRARSKISYTLVDALSRSNDQIVQFSSHVATVSQVLADSSTDLASSLDALNPCADRRARLPQRQQRTRITGQVEKLAGLHHAADRAQHRTSSKYSTSLPTDCQLLQHLQPRTRVDRGDPSLPNFGNPVQFLCAGVYDAAATPEYYKRTEICRERMAPVLKRLMMNFPPVLFHPITSITAYKGQMVYDTPATQAKAQTPVSQLQWQPLPGAAAHRHCARHRSLGTHAAPAASGTRRHPGAPTNGCLRSTTRPGR